MAKLILAIFWNASKFHRLLFASSVSCIVFVGSQAREQIHVFHCFSLDAVANVNFRAALISNAN